MSVEGERIVAVEEVPPESTFLFTVRDANGDEKEAILVRTDGEVRGWLNHCQHWTDVRLDRGSGAPMRDGELVCARHGATFEPATGYCDFGPCEGAYLDDVAVSVADGDVLLTDDDYAFVRTGATERDPTERSTSPGERLGF